MNVILTLLQAAGFLAVLAGVFMLLPLAWAVLVAGLLVATTATALEWLSARASRPRAAGAE